MFKTITATLSALLISATAASAQEGEEVANNSAFGDWIVTCEAVTVSRTSCRLIQELTLRETNSLVARFIAFPAADGTAVLLAQVPMGVYLPGGAVYRFANDEDAEQREMIWQRCLGDVCEAAIALSVEELASFADAQTLLFGYRADVQSEPIITSVDVSEFSAGIDTIRLPAE